MTGSIVGILAFLLWSLFLYWFGYDMAIAKKKREAEEHEWWDTYGEDA